MRLNEGTPFFLHDFTQAKTETHLQQAKTYILTLRFRASLKGVEGQSCSLSASSLVHERLSSAMNDSAACLANASVLEIHEIPNLNAQTPILQISATLIVDSDKVFF